MMLQGSQSAFTHILSHLILTTEASMLEQLLP